MTRCTVSAVSVVLIAQMCSRAPRRPPQAATGRCAPRADRCALGRRSARARPNRAAGPGAPHDGGRDDEAGERVEPQPAGEKDPDSRDDDAERDRSVRGKVQERAAHVDVAPPIAREQHRARPLIMMPTSATQITVSPATGIGAARRLIASQAMPPVTTSRSAAFSSATRIDELRRP